MTAENSKLPDKYWVVGYEKYEAQGGFDDVIYTTNDLEKAYEALENYVYEFFHQLNGEKRVGYIYNIYTKEYGYIT